MRAEHTTPEPRTDIALDFLTKISPDRWDIAAIPPDGGRPEFRTFDPRSASLAASFIDLHQGKAGLYYQFNRPRSKLQNRKATKADIEAARGLHVDLDVVDAYTLERLKAFAPRPSVIVFSGGGYQPLWLLQDVSTEFNRVERLNRALAQALGGDNCHNIDRLLRLPGTINMPNAKKRAAGRVPVLARVI